jgi:cytochrome oxidase Cu insertion factor (SCO1/SenC/PrrC family)
MKRFLVAIFLLLAGCGFQPEIPVFYPAPDFSLTERSNRTVTLENLRGKVWVADFIFTSCAGMCPVMSGKMQRLQATLPAGVGFVSFTVDPERDTPEVLTAYAKRYGADPERWLFLTGPKDALHRLSRDGFKLALEEATGTVIEPITHSSRFVLVDKAGQIRGYYSAEEDEAMSRLAEDAKALL